MEPTEVIRIEAANYRHIHLYHHKGIVWQCYGRSALLLHKIYPNISCHERDISGKGDIIPVMIIDPMTLANLTKNLPPIYQDKERMVIEIPETLAYLYIEYKVTTAIRMDRTNNTPFEFF